MADKAHNETDKKLAEMEEHLSAIYEDAGKDIEEKARKYFEKFAEEDEKKKKLVESGEMTESEYNAWRQSKMMRGQRYTDMRESIAKELLNANKTAMAYVNDMLPEIYALNYNAVAPAIESLVKGYSFMLVNAETVKNLATRKKTLLPYKYVNGRKDVRWNTKQVNSAVMQGILQGESINTISKRLESVTEMNRKSAIRNARTTVTSAECKGRQDSYEQAAKDGIEIEREWIATNDMRTRHAHAYLNGKTAAVDEPFETKIQVGANLFITDEIMYPGDPNAHPANVYNCRCTISAKVVGFKSSKGLSAGGSLSKIEKAEQIGNVDYLNEQEVLNALAKGERETANLPYAVNYSVTADGKVWKVKGDNASVNPNGIPSTLVGSYSYHNHPAKETWYSFSAEDIGVFMEHKQQYSKSSDDIYEYVMRRTRKTVDMDYYTAYNEFDTVLKKEVYQLAFTDGLDIDIDGYHKTMEILAKRYNFEYSRRKK